MPASDVISLGIGSPAGIPSFLTFGLGLGDGPATPDVYDVLEGHVAIAREAVGAVAMTRVKSGLVAVCRSVEGEVER